jgi:hypothetical protein
MARACRREGDSNCAVAQYEKFIKLWTHADDLAARREAEAELRQIAGQAGGRAPVTPVTEN